MAKPIIVYELFVDFYYFTFKKQPSYKHCRSLAIEKSMRSLCAIFTWELEKIVKRKSNNKIIRKKRIYAESRNDYDLRHKEASKRKAQAESLCRMENSNVIYADSGPEF